MADDWSRLIGRAAKMARNQQSKRKTPKKTAKKKGRKKTASLMRPNSGRK